MIELQHPDDEQKRFFERIDIHQILVNPALTNYPDIFLICHDCKIYKKKEYLIGLDLAQFNLILMGLSNNEQRVAISARLGELFISGKKTGDISIRRLFGKSLEIAGIHLSTEPKLFQFEHKQKKEELYYFQMVDMQ